jgi:hypothetical protein
VAELPAVIDAGLAAIVTDGAGLVPALEPQPDTHAAMPQPITSKAVATIRGKTRVARIAVTCLPCRTPHKRRKDAIDSRPLDASARFFSCTAVSR